VGRISKWTGVSGTNTYELGDSNIFEDKFGKVGIGTTSPTSLLTVQGMIETTLGGLKFPDGTVQTTAGVAPNDVVKSLNGLKGDIQLAAGSNITITPAGNTLTVAAPNALTAVAHDATLTGNGTPASPLNVVQSDPADQPFQVTLDPTFPDSTFTVPAGKRVVIEYVSGFYSVPTAASQQPVFSICVRTQIGSTTVRHIVLAHRTSLESPGFSVYSIGQNVRLYADPGTQVRSGCVPFNTLTAEVALSGHFVNAP
jgi:hypothetical protein